MLKISSGILLMLVTVACCNCYNATGKISKHEYELCQENVVITDYQDNSLYYISSDGRSVFALHINKNEKLLFTCNGVICDLEVTSQGFNILEHDDYNLFLLTINPDSNHSDTLFNGIYNEGSDYSLTENLAIIEIVGGQIKIREPSNFNVLCLHEINADDVVAASIYTYSDNSYSTVVVSERGYSIAKTLGGQTELIDISDCALYKRSIYTSYLIYKSGIMVQNPIFKQHQSGFIEGEVTGSRIYHYLLKSQQWREIIKLSQPGDLVYCNNNVFIIYNRQDNLVAVYNYSL